MTVRVLVTGGRSFDDYETVGRSLSAIHRNYGIGALIAGGAAGADRLAALWANSNRPDPQPTDA
jgi:hypothetical protein